MKKNRLLSVALSIMMVCFSVPARTVQTADVFAADAEYSYNNLLKYRIDDGQITVTACAVEAAELVIPAEIGGYPVTAIESRAFSGATNLRRVILPDSLTDLGDRAFVDCTSLTSITLPEGLSVISHNTFNGCTALTSVKIPDTVRTIGTGAFRNCTALSDISFPPELDYVRNDAFTDTAWLANQPEGFVCFANVLYSYQGTMPENTSLTLDKSITVIADAALLDQTDLSAVDLHEGVRYIGWAAFQNTGIISVKLPENCRTDSSVFSRCKKLRTAVIPGTVKEIKSSTFSECSALEDLTIGEGIEIIDSLAFLDCNALKSIHVPASIQEIGGSAFGMYTVQSVGGFMIQYLEPVEGFTVYGCKGTAAETYAAEFGLTFIAEDPPHPVKRKGDINADGQFNIADVFLLHKYLLTIEKTLPDWEAGDMDDNERLNASDLSLMKYALLSLPDAEL